jgi:autotransporter translocation and assembly factor TamB
MRKRRAFAFALLALAGVALGLVLLAIGAVIAVSHGWQRERVRLAVEELLASALADAGVRGEVHIGGLTGPLYPTLALTDLSLAQDGVTVARVTRVDVSLDLRSLWSERRWIVSKLRVEGASVSLAPDAKGEWPWQGEPSPVRAAEAETVRPVSVEIRELEVAGARLDATWTQSGKPSHVAGTLDGGARELVLPRTGDPSWPRSASASLALEPGLVGGRALLGAELVAALEGSKLRLAKSHFESAFGKVRVTGDTDLAGWLDPARAASARVEAEADALDLAVLLARPELAGTVGGKLRIDAIHSAGTELEGSRADVSLTLAKSKIGRLSISGGELRGTYNAGKWRLENATLTSSAARLDARGSGDLERIAALDAKLEVSDLSALAAVANADARGTARAKISVTGPWRAPNGAVELESHDLRARGLDVGSVTLRARSTGLDRYRIEPLAVAGPLLSLSAEGPVLLRRAGDGVQIEQARLRLGEHEAVALKGALSPSSVRALRVDFERVALERFGSLAGLEESLGGRVTGWITANGPLPRPALSAELRWDGPQLGEIAAQSIAVTLATTAGVLRGDGRIRAKDQDLLRAQFATPWSSRTDLSRALESPETLLLVTGTDLDLALAQELVPASVRQVEGKANVRIELRGGKPEPTLSGELAVANASCDLPALAQRVGPLDARVSLTRDAVRVDSFKLRAGTTGVADVRGEVRLASLRPSVADLEVHLDDFPVRWQTMLQTHAFGSVTLRGPVESLVAQGHLELRKLRYSLAGGTDPLLGEVTVRDSSVEPRRPRPKRDEVPAFWDKASVDVRVTIPNDGRVQGQGANLEIAGQLDAKKSPGGPLAVKGAIDTTHGSYRIRGKTFIVELAHVEFTGRPDLDPDLDVRAMHRVRNIRVYAIVRGRASAPSIQLSSDPPYPQDDVLALLLFGKTRDELSQQQAGALQSALAGTAGVAAIESLSNRLGFDIPIDTVEVEDSKSTSETTLGVGGYITEDVFVRYGRGLGSEAENNVRVDWRFQKRWSVETSLSTRGDSSVDLVWTYDY